MLFLPFRCLCNVAFPLSSCPESMKKITPGHACGAPTKFSRRIQRRQARGICMPLRVRNQRSAGPLPDDSRSIVHAAPKEPPLGRASPFGVRPFRAGSAGPNPCRTLLMRDAPLFQFFSFPGNAVIIPRPGYLVNAKIPAAVWRRGKGSSGFPRGKVRCPAPGNQLTFSVPSWAVRPRARFP